MQFLRYRAAVNLPEADGLGAIHMAYLDDVEDGDVLGFIILLCAGMRRYHDVLGLQQPPHHIQHCTSMSNSIICMIGHSDLPWHQHAILTM